MNPAQQQMQELVTQILAMPGKPKDWPVAPFGGLAMLIVNNGMNPLVNPFFPGAAGSAPPPEAFKKMMHPRIAEVTKAVLRQKLPEMLWVYAGLYKAVQALRAARDECYDWMRVRQALISAAAAAANQLEPAGANEVQATQAAGSLEISSGILTILSLILGIVGTPFTAGASMALLGLSITAGAAGSLTGLVNGIASKDVVNSTMATLKDALAADVVATTRVEQLLNDVGIAWGYLDRTTRHMTGALMQAYSTVPVMDWYAASEGMAPITLQEVVDGWAVLHSSLIGQFVHVVALATTPTGIFGLPAWVDWVKDAGVGAKVIWDLKNVALLPYEACRVMLDSVRLVSARLSTVVGTTMGDLVKAGMPAISKSLSTAALKLAAPDLAVSIFGSIGKAGGAFSVGFTAAGGIYSLYDGISSVINAPNSSQARSTAGQVRQSVAKLLAEYEGICASLAGFAPCTQPGEAYIDRISRLRYSLVTELKSPDPSAEPPVDQYRNKRGMLVSPGGHFRLVLETNGNMALLHGIPDSPADHDRHVVWQTGTGSPEEVYSPSSFRQPYSLRFDYYGNVLLRAYSDELLWPADGGNLTQTWGGTMNEGVDMELVLRDDGNLVMQLPAETRYDVNAKPALVWHMHSTAQPFVPTARWYLTGWV